MIWLSETFKPVINLYETSKNNNDDECIKCMHHLFNANLLACLKSNKLIQIWCL